MTLALIDWVIIGCFFAVIILIGLAFSRKAGQSSAEFFLGGRSMPWWLLGISMVACTFSCDTPNLVTGMVRSGGVVANWAWWAFLITGMVTVFIYAQLWRRSRVMTDLEFYELRYSGKSAAFIRGFRSLYLGILFNCLIMGTVTLAAIKIGQVIFDVRPWVAVVLGSVGVVIYATAGGIKSCIWADFFQYAVAMFGAVYAAIFVCGQPEVGGLSALLAHPEVAGKLNWMPDFSNWLGWVPLLLIPVAVQWWAVWYPGAEPGGGGYIAQRMLAAKDEKNAIGATLFFNFMHYAIRPWPWIIVALASLIAYPSLESIKGEFPGIDPSYLRADIAYPVMISKLGAGWLGLVVASLIAAYMSTIGTHLNWGSSYVVNDWYRRFMKPNASEKELVRVGRLCTVVLMLIAGVFALTFLESANQGFEILLLSGAGTGAIYLLRWFWWRINAWTEISAMIVAAAAAFWIVLGMGTEGTVRCYVDSSLVRDRVYVIEDAATVDAVRTQRQGLQQEIARLDDELNDLVADWRKADSTARDEVRVRYDLKLKETEQLRMAAAVPSLVTGMKNASWQPGLQAFLGGQQEAYDGIIKGGRIYIYHGDLNNLKFSVQLLLCVGLVTVVWVTVTLLTRPADRETLRRFYRICHPGGPGWRKIVLEARAQGIELDCRNDVGDWKLPMQILCVFLGCAAIYAFLFSVGNFVYGNPVWGSVLAAAAGVATLLLFKCVSRIGIENESAGNSVNTEPACETASATKSS